jgi:hypothetical protein
MVPEILSAYERRRLMMRVLLCDRPNLNRRIFMCVGLMVRTHSYLKRRRTTVQITMVASRDTQNTKNFSQGRFDCQLGWSTSTPTVTQHG